MEFRTIVPLPATAPTITPQTHALVLGSCFAEHIGDRLRTTLGPAQCSVNPFGVLYNPMSIAQALEIMLRRLGELGESGSLDSRESLESLESLDSRESLDSLISLPPHPIFIGRDGLWHSWLHSTHYSAPTREECRERCCTAIDEACRILARADLLIVTFGTSRCYLLNDDAIGEATDFVVANCHKELATRFTERDCTVDEIVATWRPLLAALHRLRPTLQVVFTVSPYRYRKYGYHASQLAKARLLLAVEELSRPTPPAPRAGEADTTAIKKASAPAVTIPPVRGDREAVLFPAYEIMLDELRDYRFYKPDMLHPSEQAVDYIWERFSEWSFTPETHHLYAQHIKQLKALNHHANH